MRPLRMMAIAALLPFAVATVSAAELSNRDEKYLRERAQSLMADIQAGQMASKKAETQLVRAFAYRLVADHQRALEKVKGLAAARNVELPAAPTERELRSVNQLTGLTGTDFDIRYIKRAILQHKDGTKADRKNMYATKDPELRQLASASHDVESVHLAMANRALGSIPVKK